MSTVRYAVAGTSALKPRHACGARLRVVDGGRSARPSRRRASRAATFGYLLVIVAIVSSFAFAAFAVSSARESSALAAAESISWEQARVSKGDSLWSIAEDRPVNGLTTSELSHVIKDKNGLQTSMLSAGDRLLVPVR